MTRSEINTSTSLYIKKLKTVCEMLASTSTCAIHVFVCPFRPRHNSKVSEIPNFCRLDRNNAVTEFLLRQTQHSFLVNLHMIIR